MYSPPSSYSMASSTDTPPPSSHPSPQTPPSPPTTSFFPSVPATIFTPAPATATTGCLTPRETEPSPLTPFTDISSSHRLFTPVTLAERRGFYNSRKRRRSTQISPTNTRDAKIVKLTHSNEAWKLLSPISPRSPTQFIYFRPATPKLEISPPPEDTTPPPPPEDTAPPPPPPPEPYTRPPDHPERIAAHLIHEAEKALFNHLLYNDCSHAPAYVIWNFLDREEGLGMMEDVMRSKNGMENWKVQGRVVDVLEEIGSRGAEYVEALKRVVQLREELVGVVKERSERGRCLWDGLEGVRKAWRW